MRAARRWVPILSIGLAAGAWAWTQEQTASASDTEKAPVVLVDLDALRERARAEKLTYSSFLERDTLTSGLYRLPAGSTDGQQPHDLDEVYYVLAGRAQIEVEGESQPVEPGSVVFVAAHAQHRFHGIEEDLELLVFFSRAPVPTEAGDR